MRVLGRVVLAASLVVVVAAQGARAERGKQIDFFRYGVPKDRVPGVGLLKLKGINPGRLVVARANDPASRVLKDIGGRSGVAIEFIRPAAFGWALVELRDPATDVVPDEKETLQLLERIARDPAVQAVSEDKWMRALATPNDPGLEQMWHFDSIGAKAAWDITQGTTNQRVGIIDTGLLRAHEDVGSRAVAGFDFISDDQAANDGGGRDSDFNDAGDACNGPDSFHGTHVAGTIGARANNAIGVVGLNWNAGLVIARTLGRCGGDLADIADAADWLSGGSVAGVPATSKVSVMNLSLGSDAACSDFEQDMVTVVNSRGSIFVAAAGNSTPSTPVGSPANCSGAIAVGAHGPAADRRIAPYSSFGDEIAIMAPGGDMNFGSGGGVLSAIGPNVDGYIFEEGTSMATPHVTGAISLMQARNASLTRTQIVSLLQSTGASCASCGTKKAMVLSAALAAVDAGQEPPAPPPPAGDDALEENDEFDTAKSGINCGQIRSLQALAGDQDWFLLPTLAGEGIDISIAATNGADLDLYVLDGPTNDDVIQRSESTGGEESVHVDAVGGDLRVLVNPYVDTGAGISHEGPYTITIECTGNTPDPVEPDPEPQPDPDPDPVDPPSSDDELEDNDTPDQALEMFCEQERDLALLDDDYFFVRTRNGDTLRADVTASGVRVQTSILTRDGRELATGSGESPAVAEGITAGSYIVKVSGDRGSYKLRTGCAPAEQLQAAARGGCSSAGDAAAPTGVAFVVLALVRLRRRR